MPLFYDSTKDKKQAVTHAVVDEFARHMFQAARTILLAHGHLLTHPTAKRILRVMRETDLNRRVDQALVQLKRDGERDLEWALTLYRLEARELGRLAATAYLQRTGEEDDRP